MLTIPIGDGETPVHPGKYPFFTSNQNGGRKGKNIKTPVFTQRKQGRKNGSFNSMFILGLRLRYIFGSLGPFQMG